jgi:TonB-linked SusC/RagA family outer membrane protein
MKQKPLPKSKEFSSFFMKELLLLVLLALATLSLKANPAKQAITVSGTVTSTSNEALPGVNIVIKGTSIGTSTDVDGKYSLEVPNEDDILIFSSIGFVTEEVSINGQSVIDIILTSDIRSLDELVIVGYGVQKRSSLTSAVSDISSEELQERPVTNTRQILQGLAPGLTVTDQGGSPGGGDIRYRLRGYTTIGDNEPLIIVDGIEQRLYDMDPNSIESVSVLKDASATAIYGSRGANGVILVTTKVGKAGDFTLTYDGYVAVQQVAYKPEHMDVQPFMRLRNAALENVGSAPAFTKEEIEAYPGLHAEDPYQYPLPNAMWDALFSPAPQQNHTIAVSGGTEQMNARLAVNYFDQGGVLPNFNAEGQGVRLNTNFKVTEALKVEAKINYRQRKRQEPTGAGDVYWGLWHHNNWTVPQYPDGTYGLSINGQNAFMYANESGTWNETRDYLMTSLQASLEIVDGLVLTSQYGGFIESDVNKRHVRSYEVRDYYDPDIVRKTVGPISLREQRDRNTQYTFKNLLNYEVDFGVHAIKALLGYSEIRMDYGELSARRTDFYNNQLTVLSAGSEENQFNGALASEEALRSFFGRVSYSFDDKYLFEASARYDGSSRFTGSNNQYSFFPSFSAAWRISKEDFWEPLMGVVNDFKLRASRGEAGNLAESNLGRYSFYSSLSPSSYTFGGQIVDAYSLTGIANPDLTWETTTQTDIGVDAQFLDGRFGLTFDYFKKRTEGILLPLPIPGMVGLPAPFQNAGIVDNWGWELQLTHRNMDSSGDFSYSITANLADVKNEVIDLVGTGPYIYAGEILELAQVGEPLYSFYGYKALGYFDNQEEIDNYPTFDAKSNTFPGDIKYEDVNRDGEITTDDQVPIGSQIPRYTYGLSAGINYKNFDLSFFIQGVGKVDKIIYGAAREHGIWGDYNFTPAISEDYWTEDNRDARFPRPANRAQKNTRNSSWWVIDAAYIRLKNAQLGYTLPKKLTEKAGINNARLYISGTNLFTLSEATDWGVDPEAPSGRLAYYPQTRVFSLGVNLKF